MHDAVSTNNKHLTSDGRQETQLCLDRGMTFKAIARRVGEDPTTISKEVKSHISVQATAEQQRTQPQRAHDFDR